MDSSVMQHTLLLCMRVCVCVRACVTTDVMLQLHYLQVYAAATEDMDCLTFGTHVLLRHLTASESK